MTLQITSDKQREYKDPDEVAEALNKRYELEQKRDALKSKLKTENPKQTPENNTNLKSKIQSIGDFWRIENVPYRNGSCTADLSKSLLDNGNAKTQDAWAQYSKQAKQNKSFYVGDMPLYHAIFTALYQQKNKPESEEARQFIQKQMREKWLTTLTRIIYQPTGKDKIIHNYSMDNQYEKNENIVGPDRFIEKADSNALGALLGTNNIDEIKAVYNWINKTDTNIWRFNEKPDSIEERVACFDAVSGWAYLYCSWDPTATNSGLGVRIITGEPN